MPILIGLHYSREYYTDLGRDSRALKVTLFKLNSCDWHLLCIKSCIMKCIATGMHEYLSRRVLLYIKSDSRRKMRWERSAESRRVLKIEQSFKPKVIHLEVLWYSAYESHPWRNRHLERQSMHSKVDLLLNKWSQKLNIE